MAPRTMKEYILNSKILRTANLRKDKKRKKCDSLNKEKFSIHSIPSCKLCAKDG